MTPREIFNELVTLFPKAWDAEQKIAWAKMFDRVLSGIEPDVLAKAYDRTMKGHKYSKPPTPGEIRDHIEAPQAEKKANEVPAQWPYRKEAHTALLGDPRAISAVKEGWGLGMWEFIAKNGRLPNSSESAHLIDTNNLFHKQYTVCGTGQKIEMPTPEGPKMLIVQEHLRGLFEKQMEKRETILEKYGK